MFFDDARHGVPLRRRPVWACRLGMLVWVAGVACTEHFSGESLGAGQGTSAIPLSPASPPASGEPNTATGDTHQSSPTPPDLAPVYVPLAGCSTADYAGAVTIAGDQTFQVIMDTGSSTLAVASRACNNCTGISPTYTPGASAVDQHHVSMSEYGGGNAWQGEVYTDTVTFGGDMNAVSMALVAIGQQSVDAGSERSFFNPSECSGTPVRNTTQGIMGLGRKADAAPFTDAFVDQLFSQSPLPRVFAGQFCDVGGGFWFGGWDANHTSGPPVYVPMSATTTGWYEVGTLSLSLGETALGAASDFGATVVDTGTSVLLVTQGVFDTMTAALADNSVFAANFTTEMFAGKVCEMPRQASRADLDAGLPPLVVVLDSGTATPQTLTMKATDSYLMALDGGAGRVLYCFAIYAGAGQKGVPNLLMGNNLMHAYVTIFDVDGHRLGFAPQAGCSRL